MASEEVSKPPSHPSYPEMIMAAIAALGDKDGSNKSAIAKYIAATYQDLPESHASLLTAHLASMKEAGELLFVKNNYLLPGPDVPPKRGRGRPPKPKPDGGGGGGGDGGGGAAAAPQSPRPRGRPPKSKDPLAAAVAKAASGMPRKRGRPPKAAVAAAAPVSSDAGSTAPVSGVKRGRGRPPKVRPAVADPAAAAATDEAGE